jgi:hypothetical protein
MVASTGGSMPDSTAAVPTIVPAKTGASGWRIVVAVVVQYDNVAGVDATPVLSAPRNHQSGEDDADGYGRGLLHSPLAPAFPLKTDVRRSFKFQRSGLKAIHVFQGSSLKQKARNMTARGLTASSLH